MGERIIGLDVGQKRIGLAQSDLLGILASPVGTFNHQEIIPKIEELMRASIISAIVVGWPLSLNDHENRTTELVQQFINRLQNKFKKISIVKVDERFSSEMAKKAIFESGMKQKRRRQKGLIDNIAATIILQEYLDNDIAL